MTFARYTGDTPKSRELAEKYEPQKLRSVSLCDEAVWYREEIRNPRNLPNILMINYSMLEYLYLLLRKLNIPWQIAGKQCHV